VVATEKRRPDTHGGDARPNHSTVGQERGTQPCYRHYTAILETEGGAKSEARGWDRLVDPAGEHRGEQRAFGPATGLTFWLKLLTSAL